MSRPALAVIIPTRNRASLAINAIRSLRGQRGSSLHVLVSDNSTDEAEVARLADFCRGSRVTYLRPPEPLAMPTHWNWAIEQAMEQSAASHFAVHYDRRVSKPGHLRLLQDAMARVPDLLVTHSVDLVVDQAPGFVAAQTPWTGEVYAIETARVRQMVAEGKVTELGQAFPVLSNCAVPRAVLTAIRERFGDVCDSTGPDSCFTFRFCALHDRYAHFDRPLGLIYASHRSNGLGYLRASGGDFHDFVAAWGDRPWLDAAPIPGVNLGQNMLFHEYELVRRAVGGDRFPALDREGYVRQLGTGLQWVADPDVKAELATLLREHSWEPEPEPEPPQPAPLPPQPQPRSRLTPRRIVRGVVARTWTRYRGRPRVVLFLARYLHVKPDHIAGFSFASEAEAMRYMLLCPRRATAVNEFLAPLQPTELTPGRS